MKWVFEDLRRWDTEPDRIVEVWKSRAKNEQLNAGSWRFELFLILKGTIREEVRSWAPNVKGNKEALQTHSSHLLLEWLWIQCGVDELDARAALPCLRLIVVLRIQWNKTTLFCPTRHIFYLGSTSDCHPTGVWLNRARNSFIPQSIKMLRKCECSDLEAPQPLWCFAFAFASCLVFLWQFALRGFPVSIRNMCLG